MELHHAIDWSKIGGWHKTLNFHQPGEQCEYEEVRELEMRTLYNMRSIEIRTTMHFLLLNNEDVSKYYDLEIEEFRNVYLQMINTSFDKKQAGKYLKSNIIK